MQVLWPSAYGGGLPLRAYSSLYHYHIVPAGWGDVRDITGEVVPGVNETARDVFLAEIDLDRTLVHVVSYYSLMPLCTPQRSILQEGGVGPVGTG